ncbi:MAG TPA: hypothetical protein IAC52_03980 [Candidatus Enteromonas pullicola]|uniref:Uncharacterized protein n=1 Tax=Candidatus Alloenteromonas pullicola TaxID=2840784 RepID=A0A9D1LP72_9FIRM|nr:hypothetical protein [Candidatus Enteromonas pullicola]
MGSKKTLILTAAVSLLATLSISVATYAWFLTSFGANGGKTINLTSGVSSVMVTAKAYSMNADENGGFIARNSISIDKAGNATAEGQDSGPTISSSSLSVSFNQVVDPYDYLPLYVNEVSLNREKLPRAYVELEYRQDNVGGYVRVEVEPTVEGNPIQWSYGEYEYASYLRSFTYRNDESAPSEESIRQKLENRNANGENPDSSVWKSLSSSADVYSGQLHVDPLNQYANGELYYSCATLLEITIDPLPFLDLLMDTMQSADQAASGVKFSLSLGFKLNISYSSSPFRDEAGNELPIAELNPGSYLEGGNP